MACAGEAIRPVNADTIIVRAAAKPRASGYSATCALKRARPSPARRIRSAVRAAVSGPPCADRYERHNPHRHGVHCVHDRFRQAYAVGPRRASVAQAGDLEYWPTGNAVLLGLAMLVEALALLTIGGRPLDLETEPGQLHECDSCGSPPCERSFEPDRAEPAAVALYNARSRPLPRELPGYQQMPSSVFSRSSSFRLRG